MCQQVETAGGVPGRLGRLSCASRVHGEESIGSSSNLSASCGKPALPPHPQPRACWFPRLTLRRTSGGSGRVAAIAGGSLGGSAWCGVPTGSAGAVHVELHWVCWDVPGPNEWAGRPSRVDAQGCLVYAHPATRRGYTAAVLSSPPVRQGAVRVVVPEVAGGSQQL